MKWWWNLLNTLKAVRFTYDTMQVFLPPSRARILGRVVHGAQTIWQVTFDNLTTVLRLMALYVVFHLCQESGVVPPSEHLVPLSMLPYVISNLTPAYDTLRCDSLTSRGHSLLQREPENRCVTSCVVWSISIIFVLLKTKTNIIHFKLSNYYRKLLTVHEIAACDKLNSGEMWFLDVFRMLLLEYVCHV